MPFEDYFKEFFVCLLSDLLNKAFEFFNMSFSDEKGGGMAMLSQTPNDVLGGDVLTKIESVTNVAIIPFASVILTYVVCYDLITTCINGNNFREFDTSIFFKFAIKGGIATYLLGKSTTIALAFFDVASEATTKASKQIVISQTPVTNIDMLKFNEELLESNLGELVGLVLLTLLLYIVMIAIYVIIFVVLIGRALEAMVYCAFAPIPIATLTNKEWGSMGTNYLKAVAALAFQVVLIMIILGVFSGLMQGLLGQAVNNVPELSKHILKCVAYGAVLCFSLLKTGNLSKSLFQAH